MIQHTYEIAENSLDETLSAIAKSPDYREAKERLLIVYEPICRKDFLEAEIGTIREKLPAAKAVGMTTFGQLDKTLQYQKHTRLSLLLFASSSVDIFESDCRGKNLTILGTTFAHEFQSLPDLKGILCLSSCAQLCPTPLLKELGLHYPDIPIFGALAGTPSLAKDESKIFTSRNIYDKGILLVAFRGKELAIETRYCLGWKPLGREHIVTESDSNGFVSAIDNLPISRLYEKYLAVQFNHFFNANACAFPLLTKDGNTLLAKVPIRYTDDGKIAFPTEIKVGSKVFLSYSKPEYLLRETLSSANAIARFQPEAILLYACVNRQLFMGNRNADRELEYFSKIVRESCTSYGSGEILFTKDGGGVLNSSIVAIAFRERKPDIALIPPPITDKKLDAKKKSIPLSDRLVTFLEATTEDLNTTIRQLSDLAEHDQLTHLFNRRKLNEILEYELGKRRSDGDFSVLMYDIDFFKKVNDTFGHDVGDHVLSKLSDLISASIRSCDVLGRWGGEEFVCILSNTNLNGAKILAERIRRQVETADFSPLKQLTISIGITDAKANDTYQGLLQRLDKALYDAKKGGRNRVAAR